MRGARSVPKRDTVLSDYNKNGLTSTNYKPTFNEPLGTNDIINKRLGG